MKFSQLPFSRTQLPDDPILRKAFDILQGQVARSIEDNEDKINQQIEAAKSQMLASVGGAVDPLQEEMLTEQLRGEILAQFANMPITTALTAAMRILDSSSLAERDKDKAIKLAAAALVSAPITGQDFDEAVLDELPPETSTPAYEMWQSRSAMMGAGSMQSVFANASDETRILALAYIVDQPKMMMSVLRQIEQARAIMGEDADLPPEMRIRREHLMSLRASGNYLGQVDDGLKQIFDRNFQKLSDTFAKQEALPQTGLSRAMRGMRVVRL